MTRGSNNKKTRQMQENKIKKRYNIYSANVHTKGMAVLIKEGHMCCRLFTKKSKNPQKWGFLKNLKKRCFLGFSAADGLLDT